MGMQLSGLAQLVARLKGLGDEHPELDEATDPFSPVGAELTPAPRVDPFAEVVRAVAGSRQRLEALAGRLADLRRQADLRRRARGQAAGEPARPMK
jgi:hypothetical protein